MTKASKDTAEVCVKILNRLMATRDASRDSYKKMKQVSDVEYAANLCYTGRAYKKSEYFKTLDSCLEQVDKIFKAVSDATHQMRIRKEILYDIEYAEAKIFEAREVLFKYAREHPEIAQD